MDIQWIIISIIGIAVAIKVIHSLYKFFFVKKDSCHCGGCCGCDLGKEDNLNKKRQGSNFLR